MFISKENLGLKESCGTPYAKKHIFTEPPTFPKMEFFNSYGH
jgi:hypothetical protein